MVYTAKDIKHLETMKELSNSAPIENDAVELQERRAEQTVNESILKLCSSLRSSGLTARADSVENKFLSYLQAANTHLYRVHDEDGEDLVDQAHPEGDHHVEDGDLGDVETIVSKHKKIVDVITKEPTGKLANYVLQCKIALGASFLAQAQDITNTYYDIANDALDKFHSAYDNVKIGMGDDAGENDQFFSALKDVLDKRNVHTMVDSDFAASLTNAMNDLKDAIEPSFLGHPIDSIFSPGKQEEKQKAVQKYFPALKNYADRFAAAIRKIEQAEGKVEEAKETQEAKYVDPEYKNSVIQKLNGLITELTVYGQNQKVSSNPSSAKYVPVQITEIKGLIEQIQQGDMTKELSDHVSKVEAEVNKFAKDWNLI
jgi:hypothetical protein